MRAFISKNRENVLEMYKDIVSISSESYDKAGVDAVCDYLADFGLKNGFSVEKTVNEKAGNELVLTLNGESEGPVTVFLAHMDTVHKKGSFKKMITEKDGILYGPGVHDCKGGIAVSFLTALALKERGYKNPLRIVLVCDEEVSMLLSGEKGINFIKDNVKDASYVFTCESGIRNKIVVGRKGAGRFIVTIKGKSAHAGANYNAGASAIREACLKIPELEKLSDADRITYNCGLISGGKAPNIVPDFCEFVIDTRYRNREEMEESEKTIRSIMEKCIIYGTETEVKLFTRHEAMPATENNIKLFERVKKVASELGYEDFEPMISGGASDASLPTIMGIPTLCAMGISGKNQHTPEEQAEIISLTERSHTISETILSLEKECL